MATWVYLMKDHRSGFYKIGRSSQPCFREKTLQAEVPLVEIVEAWWARHEDEKNLHSLFGEARLRGEWFDLEDEDLERIYEYFIDNKRLIGHGTYRKELKRLAAVRLAEQEQDKLDYEAEMNIQHEAWDPDDLSFNAAAIDFLVEGFGDNI